MSSSIEEGTLNLKGDQEEIQRMIFILSFVYYLFCKLFLFKRSNRWLEFLGEWTSIFEEEYEIPDCLMAFVL
jgi:hypothetical protein